MGISLFLSFVVIFSSFVTCQYPEGSGLYNQSLVAGKKTLGDQIEKHPDIEYVIHPDRAMIYTSDYYFIEPEYEDYTIGIIVDPVRRFFF